LVFMMQRSGVYLYPKMLEEYEGIKYIIDIFPENIQSLVSTVYVCNRQLKDFIRKYNGSEGQAVDASLDVIRETLDWLQASKYAPELQSFINGELEQFCKNNANYLCSRVYSR